MIPTTSKWVRTDLLHPQMMSRLEHFFQDGRIKNRVKVVSACRSLADQQRLYDKYRAGTGNLAANPERTLPGGWKGSWHMQQADGWCHAVDFRIVNRGVTTQEVNRIAKAYGLRRTVPSEWWHHQWRDSAREFPAPAVEYSRSEQVQHPAMDWPGVVAAVASFGRAIGRYPLRRGARGNVVMFIQQRLSDLGFSPGRPDGVFGRKTHRAVRQFQESRGLVADGVFGSRSYRVMWLPDPLLDGLYQ